MASEAQTQTQQPVSAEEEAVKRNTDCVYFLASPLTCKKGSECEYRHSEIARLNPRDCWYWTNGNCLNPKCGFRHPPLEGFVSAQAPTSTGPSVPQTQTQTATTTTTYAGNNPGKQGVPCVFFQRGYCLKGDWCPFLHVPSSSSNKTLPVPAYESATLKKAVEGIENSAQEKKAQTLPVAKSVDVHVAKTTAAVQTANLKNEFTVERRAQQASAANEFPGYRNTPPIFNGNQVNWPNRVQNPHPLDVPESLNSKDEDEVSREPSPGFDVLVDDEGRDSDYYPGEDRHGMPIGHEMNEYDIGPSSDYFDCDDERYQDPLGYDSHEGRQVQYSWEQRRASSERMLSGGSYLERRPYGRNDGHVQVDESDLRHRLSRHKKPNGLRSVVSRDMHFRDRSRQGSHEERTTRDNALNSRLRGRIKLPGKPSSPTNGNIRRSPVRISVSPRKGRIQERIKGRVEDSYNNGWRNRRSPLRRDDVRDGNNVDFAGPMSLAELKNKKIAEPTGRYVDDEKPLGKRKHSLIDNQQQSGVSNNFEGPKSLEEILKRKKGETSGTKSVNKNSSDNERRVEGKTRKEVNDRTDKEVNNYASSHKKDDGDSKRDASNMIEAAEGGEHVDDGADLEVEAYEQKDGEYEYEQTGGEDYEYYDGENVDAVDEEYVEDGEEDEDDEFAKKLGVMYS